MLGQPNFLAVFLALLSIVTALLICGNAETVGRRLRVMDHPDSERKLHKRPTPLVGGIAVLSGLVLWLAAMFAVGAAPEPRLFAAILLCAAGVGLVGFVDDQSSTTPLTRILLLLTFLAVAFVADPELIAPWFNWGSFEPTRLPAWLYCLIMGVAAVGVVNAVNMADGQNGLVLGMYVVWSACLFIVAPGVISPIALVLLGTSLVVLMFNLRNRLFLGDCGTYGVTFVFGLLCMYAHARGRLSIEVITVWFFIPVADCLRILVTRLLNGRSPAEGDRDHLHHRLHDKLGPNYGRAAYLGVVALTSVTATLAPHLALLCLTLLSAFYFSFAWLSDASIEDAGAATTDPLQDGPVSEEEIGQVIPMAAAAGRSRTLRQDASR
jgi:UDP-GlcNAc:undecaprenyl-phosphate GlcNAc-1-phosphate transferase